jgi:hypothetical protein
MVCGKPRKLTVRVAGVPAEIGIEQLPNTSQDIYHYKNPFVSFR